MANQNERFSWEDDDTYWRANYRSRPYVGSKDYAFYEPGYRYGYEAANQYNDREWHEVEPELEKSWDTFKYRGESTWQHMKAAVRDAWDRVTGRRSVGAR